MDQMKPAGNDKGKPEREPMVLSRDEALYPPSKRALKIAGIAVAVLVILLVASLVLMPL